MSADGLILTGAHVIAGCSRVSASNGLIGIVDVRVLDVDRRIDAAMLKADAPTPIVLGLATGALLQRGDPVVSIGFVRGARDTLGLKRYGGQVERLAADGDVPQLEIRSPLPSGTSGGPVLDRDDQVVGMVVGRFDDRPSIVLALPAAQLSAFVSRATTAARAETTARTASPEAAMRPDENAITDFGVVRVFCR